MLSKSSSYCFNSGIKKGDFVELNLYVSLLFRGISGFKKTKVLHQTAVMCLYALPINAL